MMTYRLMKILWAFSFLGIGYILIIHPVEILWKISPFLSILWILVIAIGLYMEMILQERLTLPLWNMLWKMEGLYREMFYVLSMM